MSAPTIESAVDTAAVLRCVERDLSELTELDTVVRLAGALLRQASEESPRARQAIRIVWDTANAARQQAGRCRLVLARVRAVLQEEHTTVSAAMTVALVHGVLHGRISPTAMAPDVLTRAPLRFPVAVGVRHGALAELLRTAENLTDAVWRHAHRSRADFAEDLAQLRSWTSRVPDLRAPDRLVPVPGDAPGTYQVHRHPRPARPRTLEPDVRPVEFEVLTARQLELLHSAIRRSCSIESASRMASTAEQPLSVEAAAAAAARCGAWLRRRVEHSGHRGRRRTARSRQVWGTWLQATRRHYDLRAFAALYTPERGGWYQILRGDIPDLRGLVPMRRRHYQTLAAHVAGGGLLSDFAEQQGRRYAEVVRAWDRMTGFTADMRARRRSALDAIEAWPGRYADHVSEAVPVLVQRIRTGLAAFDCGAEETIGAVYGRLLTAVSSADTDQVAKAFRALTGVLDGYRELLRRRPVRTEPTEWGRDEFALFEKHFPDVAPSEFGSLRARARAVETVRAEVRRLLAARFTTVPGTELALLTELHREFSRALREQSRPEIPRYWRLWITPGAPDEHVWRTFREWPELIAQAATTR